MSNLFLRLLNISITAGWIVLIVVLLRFALKKAPKWIRVALWGLVAVRLLLPVSIESALSLVPSAETVAVEPMTYEIVQVKDSNPEPVPVTAEEGERIVLHSGFEALNSAVNPVILQTKANTITAVKTVAGWVWLSGAAAMLLYALISYLRLKHKVRASIKLETGVYVCDEIGDPFILGLFLPKVCLPSGMDETTRAYVLAHEKTHLKRFDHIWKPLGFLLLAVYWFNPLLWLAYILLCRDIELACDEKVVKELDDTGKAAYSEALVTASVSRRLIAACPLAFGETGVKSRVKSVLNYKKPAFWIILVAILASVAVAVCFLTMPKKDATITELSEEIQKINGTLPGNTFLYLYRDNTSYFCYSLNGENGCGTSDAYYDKPFDLFAEIRQGIITVDHDSAHIKEITRFIHDTSIGFIQNTITGSKQYSAGLFEQVLPLYTQDWHKCREIKLKENDADFPVSKGSSAYYTLNENGFELCYYGHSDKGNDNVSSMLLYIEVPDLEAVIERFAPSAASDKTPIPTASFDSITGSDAKALQWLDFYENSNDMPWDSSKEIAVDAFPNVTFRWTAGSVEAIENGKTRTLFTGMPVWNVFFTDVTGDGKPELCATVSFGSGIVDDHIVVYDYMNRQSYTLWDRGTFDYHLYTENGALLVGKTLCNSYSSDTSILDTGTLMMHDGVLCCRWSDGSVTPLNRELHESALYGEWIVEEEWDNDGNTLYTFDVASTWKEYNFRENGTVTYNETVPISSDSELAFGHPVTYPYEVHNDYVYIAGDDTSGAFRWGQSDRDTRTLTLMYSTDAGTVYALLRRMGTEGPQTIEEILLGTYVCTGAEQNGVSIPIPAEYASMTIDLGDTSEGDTYKHTSTVTIGGEIMDGHGWTLDEDDMLIVWDQKTGKSMRFEWFPKQTACTVLKLTIDQANPITLIFTFEDDVPLPASNAVLPEETEADTLTQEQADAFVNGLSVEFEDGSPYGCDLVVFIDGFGRCLNVGDADAWKTASLRFVPGDYKATDAIYAHVGYAKLLTVSDREYYIGSIRVFSHDGQLNYHHHIWDDTYPAADTSIFVYAEPSMMERNREVPERACVIKSFDAEAQTVTVSYVSFEEPEDGYPAEILYDTVEDETFTFSVTDDTMLILIDDYTALVKPDLFFRYLEQYRNTYLNGVDAFGDGDDRGIGFWIGLDGDTLLYLCEVYEE